MVRQNKQLKIWETIRMDSDEQAPKVCLGEMDEIENAVASQQAPGDSELELPRENSLLEAAEAITIFHI